jgi:hypothetical protein
MRGTQPTRLFFWVLPRILSQWHTRLRWSPTEQRAVFSLGADMAIA